MKLPLRILKDIGNETVDIVDLNNRFIITGLIQPEAEKVIKIINTHNRLLLELKSARDMIDILQEDNNDIFRCEDKIEQIDDILNYFK